MPVFLELVSRFSHGPLQVWAAGTGVRLASCCMQKEALFLMQGWSRSYAFSTGDLMACGQLLDVCIAKVGRAFVSLPWEEIRFMIGDIMYGGHITDTWDRRTNLAYLRTVFQPDILEGIADLAPGAGYSEDIGFQDTPRTGLGIHSYCKQSFALLLV